MTSPPPNRSRAWERVKHTCLAWVEGSPESAASGIARTVDLSPNGAGLVLSSSFEAGARVIVELLLPGPLRLRASGEVVHVREHEGHYRVGVRFFSAPILVGGSTKEEI